VSLRTRRARDEQIEALVLRVHPGTTEITCAACGALKRCPDASIHRRESLNGDVLYGVCDACAVPGLDGAVIARVLGLELDLGEIPEVRVTRFFEQAAAHPDRPNDEPWGHVSPEALAQSIRVARDDLAAVTLDPCRMCGDVRPIEGYGRNEGMCWACEWHLVRMFDHEDGARDYAAAWLMGLTEQSAPRGLGERVGLLFFHELAEPQSGREAFVWHTDAEVAGWYEAEFPPPPPKPAEPPMYPRRAGRAMITPRFNPVAKPKQLSRVEIVAQRRAIWCA
jgi:hypothetical protein